MRSWAVAQTAVIRTAMLLAAPALLGAQLSVRGHETESFLLSVDSGAPLPVAAKATVQVAISPGRHVLRAATPDSVYTWERTVTVKGTDHLSVAINNLKLDREHALEEVMKLRLVASVKGGGSLFLDYCPDVPDHPSYSAWLSAHRLQMRQGDRVIVLSLEHHQCDIGSVPVGLGGPPNHAIVKHMLRVRINDAVGYLSDEVLSFTRP